MDGFAGSLFCYIAEVFGRAGVKKLGRLRESVGKVSGGLGM